MQTLERWIIQRVLIPITNKLHTSFGRFLDDACNELAAEERLDPRRQWVGYDQP